MHKLIIENKSLSLTWRSVHWIAENCSALQFVSSLPGLQGLGWANYVVGFVAVVIMLFCDSSHKYFRSLVFQVLCPNACAVISTATDGTSLVLHSVWTSFGQVEQFKRYKCRKVCPLNWSSL